MTDTTWIPLERDRWPQVGDEVLYHRPDGRWVPATVLAVAQHDGDLNLDVGGEAPAVDVKHRPDPYGWLLYDEHALATKEATR